MTSGQKHIHIRYFASLREERGLSQEDILTEASTAQELYRELSVRYALSFPVERLTVSLNDEFRSMLTPLENGDRVVFIPPVAGG
jgi:molybdopterin converting factor subunit 1